ncbi:hypothetical protein N2W52_002003 [Clostridium perfringens]|nr:hypothetical protein [Clostridium perfringens]MDK0983020.1 hypothetical protein [Clostridium perfringens]
MKKYKIILHQDQSLDRRYKEMVETIIEVSKLESIYPRKDEWEEVVNGLKTYDIILELTEVELKTLKLKGFLIELC